VRRGPNSLEPPGAPAHSCAAAGRRDFLKTAALAACACALPLPLAAADDDSRFLIEARHYEKLPKQKIKCKLCPRQCVIDDRERGYCGVRENRRGTYYSLVYSRLASAHSDPIEKKPFFHMLPGAMAFSIATAGCNVNCKFCQNWEISQSRPEQLRSVYAPPGEVAAAARQDRCPVIAYTYSEPVVFFEYTMDVARAGRDLGLRSVVVSGGYIQQDPLRELCAAVDAIKIDLKSFSEKYYKEVVNGELKPVLDTLAAIRKHGRWCEIVYLVVPTLNDSDSEFKALCKWIRAELGPDVPIHFTRFHPMYLLKNLPPTPVATLERAKAIADAEGLHYVYVGNVPGHPAENTYCPKCRKVVVERLGFTIKAMHLHKGKCQFCGQPIPGVWT